MIRIKKNYGFIEWTVLVLFFVAPFAMSFENEDTASLIGARMLPSFVIESAKILRWLCFALLALFALKKVQERTQLFQFSLPIVLLSGFYFIQLLYAIIDGTDILRFFLLTVLSLLIPASISYALLKRPKIMQYFVYFILFFLVVSILLNGYMVLAGQRFFGFMNNPNAYGISCVFWMAVLLLAERNKMVNRKFFIVAFIGILITMLFSGSRNGLVGVLLVVLLSYFTQAKRFSLVLLIGGLGLFATTYFIDLNFVIDRFLNISDSFEDSGRADVWQRAYFAIEQNLWWGNGMDANYQIADTGNMHNCYIRFVLNMGLFFTIIALLFYFFSIAVTLKKYKFIPLVLPAYLIAYALMNVGEDFFVGIGSSAYIYILFIFGFINYYFLNKKEITRY